ncbi:MAG: SGNH/GDSL hydrolase family protein [Pirellulaceae bacterium]|nr:SGNH/GDSL hydrolase family protein [Pirellulaceae bacterium]
MFRFILPLTLAACLTLSPLAAQKPKPVAKPAGPLAPVQDQQGLPRILLIGDSISIGYTLPVRELLKGKANVHRPSTNCGPTSRGVSGMDQWLGKGKWDVIHFNWGLHDLKYLGPNGENLADPKAADSHQQIPPTEYEKNLQLLVKRMKKTGARLIWCTTTPVPSGAKGRVVGDSVKYNQIALRVMKEHGIAVNDLYRLSIGKLEKIQRPANVHFTPEGSRMLAEQVVKSISSQLKKK